MKTTSGNGQAWNSPSHGGQWRTGKNGGNWLQNHLWCPCDPRTYGVDDDDDEVTFLELWKVSTSKELNKIRRQNHAACSQQSKSASPKTLTSTIIDRYGWTVTTEYDFTLHSTTGHLDTNLHCWRSLGSLPKKTGSGSQSHRSWTPVNLSSRIDQILPAKQVIFDSPSPLACQRSVNSWQPCFCFKDSRSCFQADNENVSEHGMHFTLRNSTMTVCPTCCLLVMLIPELNENVGFWELVFHATQTVSVQLGMNETAMRQTLSEMPKGRSKRKASSLETVTEICHKT